MKKTPLELSSEALGDAISRLEEALELPADKQGIVIDATIQRFEFTFELFWKTTKKFLQREGIEVKTPRETLQTAYQLNWIHDEKKVAYHVIHKQLQELAFLRAKGPRLKKSKVGPYCNMDPLWIFQPRIFRAAKKPTLEVVCV